MQLAYTSTAPKIVGCGWMHAFQMAHAYYEDPSRTPRAASRPRPAPTKLARWDECPTVPAGVVPNRPEVWAIFESPSPTAIESGAKYPHDGSFQGQKSHLHTQADRIVCLSSPDGVVSIGPSSPSTRCPQNQPPEVERYAASEAASSRRRTMMPRLGERRNNDNTDAGAFRQGPSPPSHHQKAQTPCLDRPTHRSTIRWLPGIDTRRRTQPYHNLIQT